MNKYSNEFIEISDLRKFIADLQWEDFPRDLYQLLGSLVGFNELIDDITLQEDKPYANCPWFIWDSAIASMRMYVAKICACVIIGLYQKQRADKIVKKEVKK